MENSYLYCTLLVIIKIFCVATQNPSESYTYFADVGAKGLGISNQYLLYWKLTASNVIQFELYCKSNGWVGIGVSPSGSMFGADIAIGWVSGKSAYLKVRLLEIYLFTLQKTVSFFFNPYVLPVQLNYF
jgi:hypothetical protein